MSLTNPGSMSSAERTAPPGCGAASSTVTLQPRSASRFAPTRPFGPAPMTTASGMASSVLVRVTRGRARDGVHVILDARVTLDFERRVLDAELLRQHRLQFS